MPHASPELLLYSLAEYRELLFDLFALAGVRSVVEVGSEAGTFTRELSAWARAAGGSVTCVEPSPTDDLRAWHAAGDVRLVEGRSPAALAGLSADGWLLDGDHNYATVRGELDAIDRSCFAAGRSALVVLHDVGWPCARRDQYCDAGALPPDAVHPSTLERGIIPGDPGTVEDGGFRSMGRFAIALREGGARNGVLGAVEDFLRGRDDLVFSSCPLVFGAGFLFPRAAPWAAAVEAAVAPYARLPMLSRLEENRVALYLRVLADQDRRARELAAWEADRARLGELQQRLGDADARADALRREVERLTAALTAQRQQLALERDRIAAIEASLSHRLAGRVQGLKERLAPAGTLRRGACDAVIHAAKGRRAAR